MERAIARKPAKRRTPKRAAKKKKLDLHITPIIRLGWMTKDGKVLSTESAAYDRAAQLAECDPEDLMAEDVLACPGFGAFRLGAAQAAILKVLQGHIDYVLNGDDDA